MMKRMINATRATERVIVIIAMGTGGKHAHIHIAATAHVVILAVPEELVHPHVLTASPRVLGNAVIVVAMGGKHAITAMVRAKRLVMGATPMVLGIAFIVMVMG